MHRLTAVALLLGTIGCGGGPQLGEPCSSSRTCSGAAVCAFGRCRTACTDDSACGDGRCVVDAAGARGCLLDDRAESRCLNSTDCPSPLICVDSECRNGCAEARATCPAGSACVDEGGARVCDWGAMAAPDGGPVTDPDSAIGPLPVDAGTGGGGGEAWPEGFPPACIPPEGQRIGRSCETDDDCPNGFCDIERRESVPATTPEGGVQPVELVHSPGGTCVQTLVDPLVFDLPAARNSACGSCAGYTTPRPVSGWHCGEFCALGAPIPNGGCREGYICDPLSNGVICVPGCQSDESCRVQWQASGLTTASRLVDAEATCDLATGLCTQPNGDGQLMDTCSWHDDCAEGLLCAGSSGVGPSFQDLHTRISCGGNGGPFCSGWPGLCTANCLSDEECGDDGICLLPETVNRFVSAAGVCLQACTRGAEPVEDRVGVNGNGAGCPDGFGCYLTADGREACDVGGYTNVLEPNLGGSCNPPDQCWSPFGLGVCEFTGISIFDRRCTVDCSDPVLGPLACPADVGQCVDGLCRASCETAADCLDPGAGCVAVEGERACVRFCGADDDCRGGSVCGSIDPETGRGSCEPPFQVRPVCGPVTATVVPLGELGVPTETSVVMGGAAALAFAPCEAEGRAGLVAFEAPADGRIEVEAIGDGERVAGVFDATGCGLGQLNGNDYACDDGGPLSVTVSTGDVVFLAVVGAVDGPNVNAELRHRFVAEARVSEPCGLPETDCRAGLACTELGAVSRCLPDAVCGPNLPVAAFDDVAIEEDGSLRVAVPVADAPTFLSCGLPFFNGYVLRAHAAQAERWVITPTGFMAVEVRRDCLDFLSGRGCSSMGPLVVDIAAGEVFDVFSAAFTMHDLIVERRDIRVVGQSCGADAPCRPGAFCDDATGLCSAADQGCGAGVGVTDIGLRGVGRHDLSADAVYAPAATLFGPPDVFCAQGASAAVATVAFQVTEPTTAAVTTSADPGVGTVWALREGCAGAALACGVTLPDAASPELLPGRAYHLQAFANGPVEGPLEASLVLSPSP